MPFHVVEDAHCVLLSRGKYKQAKVYRRGHVLYAGIAGGFAKLYKAGGTSIPNTSWDELEVATHALDYTSLGAMCLGQELA